MSIAGFRAQNHPQQTGRRGALEDVDDRETDPEVFGPLHERFGFTLDAAASPHNAKLPRHFTKEDNGLAQAWGGSVSGATRLTPTAARGCARRGQSGLPPT